MTDLLYRPAYGVKGTTEWQRFDDGLAAANAELSLLNTHRQLTQNAHGLVYTGNGTGGLLDADLVDGQHASAFSLSGHNHDLVYSALGHNHDLAYAALGHNHDLVYSQLGHNHDLLYAAIGHNHSGVYLPVAGAGDIYTHNAAEFAVTGHNHSGVYEPVLGNPAGDNYLLKSSALGVRGWTDPATFATSGHTHAQLHDRLHAMASATDHSDWPAGLDVTELGYVNGVTSGIQGQLDGKAATGHTHTGVYEPALGNPAGDNYLLQSTMLGVRSWLDPATFAAAGHNHDASYISIVGAPTAGNFPILSAGGELDNSVYGPASFSTAGHNHDSAYISIIAVPALNKFPYQTAGGELIDSTYDASSFSLAGHNHSGVYEPVDADLTAIAALGFVSTSFLKKTAADTWALDTSTYSLSSHNHTGVYDPAGTAAAAVSSHEGTYNHANYNTAYGWGDHASAGYLTGVTADAPLSGAGTAASHLVVDLSSKQNVHANLTSLAALAYVSTSFVKMSGANTFSLDTNTYSLSSHDHAGVYETSGAVATHAALATGVHGVGVSTIASVADIATHAALQTGIHGISITAGKTFSSTGTLTLAGTDGSTLNIGTGGTLGTAAYTASGDYATAGHNHAGVYQPLDANLTSLAGLSHAVGDLIYATAATTYGALADAAVGAYLASGGIGVAPAWATLNQAAVAGLTIGSTPTFAGVLLSGLTASVPVVTDASKNLTSQAYADFKTSLVLAQADISGLTTASSPVFVTVKLSGLTDGYIPYHVADATGLTNSSIYTDGNHVGMGVSSFPAWGWFISRVVQFPNGTYFTGRTDPTAGFFLGANHYLVNYEWRYFGTDAATQYQQQNGWHYFYVAGSGAAGDPITWSTALNISSVANVGIGATQTGAGVTYQKLSVNGSQLFVGADSSQESPMFQIVPSYVVNTHASYTSRTILSQWAIGGAQECMRMESGAAAMLGFYGSNAIVRQVLAAYAADDESGAYTGAADGEAKLADLNFLRLAYENLRAAYEDMRTKVTSSTLIALP